jgi:hypothetical protein
MSIQIRQIVIWGHKLHSHTHSYIHNGFYLGFQYLGYRVYWFDDNDDVSGVDFSGSLFLTEHQVNKKIPCLANCLYLSHYVDPGDYPGVPIENIILLKVSKRDMYEADKDNHNPDFRYIELPYGQKYEYYSSIGGYHCFYTYWATDLLPPQIDTNIERVRSSVGTEGIRPVYFIGHMTGIWRKFAQLCMQNGIPFYNYGATFDPSSTRNISIEQNIELVQQSLIAPALQDLGQIQNCYIPCRIFKNISYGKMGLTNNGFVQDLFDGRLIYSEDLVSLIRLGIDFEMGGGHKTAGVVCGLMEYVRDHHTYLNRIHTLQNLIKEYTGFIL